MKAIGLRNCLIYLIALKLIASVSLYFDIFSALNEAIDALIIAVSIVMLVRAKAWTVSSLVIIYSCLGFILLGLARDIYAGQAVGAIVYYARFVIPILLALALSTPCKNISPLYRGSKRIVYLVPVLSLVGLIVVPSLENHGEELWPAYFYGLHKSSYLASLGLVLAFVLYVQSKDGVFDLRKSKLPLGIAAFVLLIFLVVGWRVRTPLLALAVFFGWLGISRIRQSQRPAVLIVLLIGFGLLGLYLSGLDWNSISSGRLGMWSTKTDMYSAATLSEKFIGRGYGSDWIEIDGWGGENDSHNNFLQVLTENGLIGLGLICAAMVGVLAQLRGTPLGAGAWLFYITTCLVSNGLMFRLLPGYLFALVFALIVASDKRSRGRGCAT